MSQRIIIIGADEPALDGVLLHLDARPEATAVALYPELNPLPEFSCMSMDRFLGRGIDFPENLRACGIDAEARQVKVRDNFSGRESTLDYDILIFASEAAPAPLDVPGEFLGGIVRVGEHADAARLRAKDTANVVIGHGLNLLMAVAALLNHGKGSITVIPHGCTPETAPLGDTLSAMVRTHLEQLGVTFLADDTLQAFEGTTRASRVITDQRTIEAGRIINATPNTPITHLAADAGIDLDPLGHIRVNESLATNIEGIYACGSCAAFVSPNCAQPVPGSAVKSVRTRQAKALAATLADIPVQFHAPQCAYSVPLGDLTVAGAGMTLQGAGTCGINALSATVIQFDRAHFMPDAELMTLELVFDTEGNVLGIQGLGKSGDALCGRISAVSALLADKPRVEDIANLEIAYSPPFASAMDVLNTVGNVAENILAGTNEGIDAGEFAKLWQDRDSDECFFIDCRETGNAEPYVERHPEHWNHISQAEIGRRLDEVPHGKRIILLCNTGARSYEAQITLKHAGYTDVVNVDGGVAAIRQAGIDV